MTYVLGEESGIDLALSPTEMVIATESPNAELGSLPTQMASLVLEQMGIGEVRLIGAGVVWLAPVADTGELNDWLSSKLGSFGEPQTYDAFGGRPSLVALNSEIQHEGFSYDVEVKPISASEAAESDEFKSDDEGDFPPAALYLEVRRSEAGEMAASSAPEAYLANLNKVITAGQKFDSAIRKGQ
jgi:hypothetical protein